MPRLTLDLPADLHAALRRLAPAERAAYVEQALRAAPPPVPAASCPPRRRQGATRLPAPPAAELRRAYEAAGTLDCLGQRYGVSASTACAWLRRAGIARQPSGPRR